MSGNSYWFTVHVNTAISYQVARPGLAIDYLYFTNKRRSTKFWQWQKNCNSPTWKYRRSKVKERFQSQGFSSTTINTNGDIDRQTSLKEVSSVLTCRFKRQLYNLRVMVRSSQVKDSEDVLPARHDLPGVAVDHLCHATDHHVTDCWWPLSTQKEK